MSFLPDWLPVWLWWAIVAIVLVSIVVWVVRTWRSLGPMDRPASMMAFVLGVLLIVASGPFLGAAGGSGTTYNIAWDQEALQKQSAQSGSANAQSMATVQVVDRAPANATITFAPCTDGAVAPLQSPATITWTLTSGSTQLKSGTTTCANAQPIVVPLGDHPDVGTATGDNATDAASKVEDPDPSKTETTPYTLTFAWTRPAGATGPIPLPPPAFSTTGSLEIKVWRATANLPGQEAPR